jgi:two-component system chemotaxis response regulator CheB
MEKDSLSTIRLVVIGGSAGSLNVLLKAMPGLAPSIPPVVIVLHRRAGEDSALTELLGFRSTIPVKEASEKEALHPGVIYVAPPDYHLLVEQDLTLSLDYSEKVNHSRPSIDVTFQTAADACGKSLCVILLSGASDDGTEGMKAARRSGALLAVQNPGTAEVAFMPQQAINQVKIDRLINGDDLSDFINSLA